MCRDGGIFLKGVEWCEVWLTFKKDMMGEVSIISFRVEAVIPNDVDMPPEFYKTGIHDHRGREYYTSEWLSSIKQAENLAMELFAFLISAKIKSLFIRELRKPVSFML